ncbi:MAG: hypothetical protein HZA01_00005 [Nitrospinae bacterium]|nr:hypothetical protein [Nitrospinota bacterium]
MTQPISKEAFISIIRNVVNTHFPDEMSAFELEGANIADDLLSGEKVATSGVKGYGEFQFIAEATSILKFIEIMLSAYEIIQKYRDIIGDLPVTQNELNDNWKIRVREKITLQS